MRDELRNIEEIESYLNGSMTMSDRIVFETKMTNDSDLKEDVLMQKMLIDEIQFLAFKSEVIAGHAIFANTKIKWWKYGNLFNIIVLSIGLFSITMVLYYLQNSSKKSDTSIEVSPNGAMTEGPVEVKNEQSINDETFQGDEMKVQNNSERISANKKESFFLLQKKFESAVLNSDIGGTITTKDSKSTIYFEPKMLLDKSGNQVTGDVIIKYREFRNQADMAFSEIPMNYYESGNEYRFNSVGMIEVRAYQNNEELKVKPGSAFIIDMNVVDQADSCYFFALNDENNKWEKKQKIDFDSLNLVLINEENKKKTPERKYRGMLEGKIDLNIWDKEWMERELPKISVSLYDPASYNRKGIESYSASVEKGGTFLITEIDSGKYIAEINCNDCDSVIIDNLTIYSDKVSQLDATISLSGRDRNRLRKFYLSKRKRERMQNLFKPSTFQLQDSIMNVKEWANSNQKFKFDSLQRSNSSVNINQMNKAMLVYGLRGENFGVYNCDQIQLVKNQITIKPTFIDINGKPLKNINRLSMIDLNVNAAFGFGPNSFNCERGGNVVLLGYEDDKLYAITANQFKEMNINSSGNYVFKLIDLTEEINTTEDLKIFLNSMKE